MQGKWTSQEFWHPSIATLVLWKHGRAVEGFEGPMRGPPDSNMAGFLILGQSQGMTHDLKSGFHCNPMGPDVELKNVT